jgi:hypothetical protein
MILTGREETYTAGKDTARFWDAGASNVHWVIATDSQVVEGVLQALGRVRSPGVIIEGTSPISLLPLNYAVMVVGSDCGRVKPSARRALDKVNSFYISGEAFPPFENPSKVAVYTNETFDALIADINAHSSLMVTLT